VRDYELGIVVSPEASEDQTRAIIDRVAQVVATGGGQVVRVNAWGRRRLAYPIDHHRDGYYVFMDLVMNPEEVAEVERNLRVSEEVIRHIIVKRDPRVVAALRAREAEAAALEPVPADTMDTGPVVEAATEPVPTAEVVQEEPSPAPEVEAEGPSEAAPEAAPAE